MKRIEERNSPLPACGEWAAGGSKPAQQARVRGRHRKRRCGAEGRLFRRRPLTPAPLVRPQAEPSSCKREANRARPPEHASCFLARDHDAVVPTRQVDFSVSIRVALHHVTHYTYDRPVDARPAGHPPAAGAALPHAGAELFAEGRAREALRQLAAGPARQLARALRLPGEGRREFTIEVDLIADMAVINPFDFFVEPYAENLPFAYPDELRAELAPYLERRAAGAAARRLSRRSCRRRGADTVDFLVDLNARIQREVGYVVRMEPGVQTPGRDPRRSAPAPAATPPGCSSRCCASSASRRASSPAT